MLAHIDKRCLPILNVMFPMTLDNEKEAEHIVPSLLCWAAAS